MLEITLDGVGMWDGKYPFDPAIPFTGTELNIIKRVSGVRLGELMDALRAGDYDLILCITAFAIINAGKASRDRAMALIEELRELPSGVITVDDAKTEEAAEPDPPVQPPSGGSENETPSGPEPAPAATSPTS